MKKIILLSSICFISLYAEVEIIDNTEKTEIIEKTKNVKKIKVEKKVKIEKYVVDEEKALKDLEILIKNKELDDSNKFEYGYFYGNIVKNNPELIKRIYKLFNHSNFTDTFIIIRKYAGMERRYFYNFTKYSIVDPLKYEKPTENIEGMLIGEYRYTRDTKYLDKLHRFSQYNQFTRYKLSKLRREIKEVDEYLQELEPEKIVEKVEKKVKKSNEIPKEEFIEKKDAITIN